MRTVKGEKGIGRTFMPLLTMSRGTSFSLHHSKHSLNPLSRPILVIKYWRTSSNRWPFFQTLSSISAKASRKGRPLRISVSERTIISMRKEREKEDRGGRTDVQLPPASLSEAKVVGRAVIAVARGDGSVEVAHEAVRSIGVDQGGRFDGHLRGKGIKSASSREGGFYCIASASIVASNVSCASPAVLPYVPALTNGKVPTLLHFKRPKMRDDVHHLRAIEPTRSSEGSLTSSSPPSVLAPPCAPSTLLRPRSAPPDRVSTSIG
jgi:hypothetical protein